MHLRRVTLLSALCCIAVATPIEKRSSSCTFAQKSAGIQHEIDTITSHSFADANQIPLALTASRTFYVTPTELHGLTLPPINVGVTGETVRAELVGLATALNASVPNNHASYINNANGSVTSDFIQNDRIALPHEHVREIHYFNDDCEITEIVGFVHGNLICPDGASPISNAVVTQLCNELTAAKTN